MVFKIRVDLDPRWLARPDYASIAFGIIMIRVRRVPGEHAPRQCVRAAQCSSVFSLFSLPRSDKCMDKVSNEELGADSFGKLPMHSLLQ